MLHLLDLHDFPKASFAYHLQQLKVVNFQRSGLILNEVAPDRDLTSLLHIGWVSGILPENRRPPKATLRALWRRLGIWTARASLLEAGGDACASQPDVGASSCIGRGIGVANVY